MEGMAAKLKRRGWCGCLRDDNEPPEITYCVVDGAGTLSLQAVTPSIPMPDEEELNAKFAELVVSTVLLACFEVKPQSKDHVRARTPAREKKI